jgi:hypothetical protein
MGCHCMVSHVLRGGPTRHTPLSTVSGVGYFDGVVVVVAVAGVVSW